MSGASTAKTTKTPSTQRPKTAPLRRKSRRQARRAGLSTAMRSVSGKACAVSAISGPQPRIDQMVGNVGEQIENDEHGRRHQHDALNDGVIAVENRIDDELAEAGDGEDLLGEHRARQQRAEFERAERNHWRQGVAQRMLDDDAPLEQAL